ncbi:MAG: molecular chaperone HtpG [Neisseriaceae bacterium]|nr:MAG: molecular chaperone HtpG [Neisseriaceae bacterium]
MKQTLNFQTEVKELLQLMIHSLYSNKEIFLRELISNGADAIDKLRFEQLNNSDLSKNNSDFKITITTDPDKKTIIISDNGIGMTEQEIIDNIGTIAKSGTKAFLGKLTGDQKKDANLIGQFGVGFYSAFIVADEVVVESRSAYVDQSKGVRWSSKGNGEFTVEPIEKEQIGTDITLHLKKEDLDLLSDWTLRRIVNTYSDHISVPIHMKKAPEYNKEGDVIPSNELEIVNQAKALWTRPKSEITEEQYQDFYHHVAHDFSNALAWIHFKVEGHQDYTGLLYIPSQAPFNLYDRETSYGIKLYVKRVFIMDDAKKLIPSYLRFVRGVIDSNDLPLNVSREILQQNKDIDTIRSGSVKKILDLISSLSKNEPEKFKIFWNQFGAVFKEGIGEDFNNKERIASLSRFSSSLNNSPEQNVSLDEYIARMQPGQDKIYYITADSYQAAKNSPHLEIFLKKNIEVLLLTDQVDEWFVNLLKEYKNKPLNSIVKGELNLESLGEQTIEGSVKDDELTNTVLEILKTALKDKVSDVRTTIRLTESPACLVVEENEMSQYLVRMLESAGAQSTGIAQGKLPILEVNSEHALFKMLSKEKNTEKAVHLAEIIFDQALLSEGGKLNNPSEFIKRMNQLIIEQ